MGNFILTSSTGWKFPNEDADHIHFTVETYDSKKPEKTVVIERTEGNGVVVEISPQLVFDFNIKLKMMVTDSMMDDLVSAKAAQATTSNLQFIITDWDGNTKTGIIVDIEEADHVRGPDNMYLAALSFLQLS